MSSTSSVSGASSTSTTTSSTDHDAFAELGTQDFLELIIAELQNQDPMNPTDTSDMLNQFNQIREIASNDNLSSTLEGVMLGQHMSTASSLIGKLVEGLTDDSEKIIGQVDAVQVDDGEPSLLVGGSYISLDNVFQIIDPALISSAEETTDDAETETEDTQTEETDEADSESVDESADDTSKE